MRRFKIMQKSEPKRFLGEGIVFINGKVAVMDWRYEIVIAFSSLEAALRDHAQAVEIEWVDAAAEAG